MKSRPLPPTHNREKRQPGRLPLSIRITPDLYHWIEKAAYQAGLTISGLIRVGARNEADRILGYNRSERLSKNRAARPESIENVNDDRRRRM